WKPPRHEARDRTDVVFRRLLWLLALHNNNTTRRPVSPSGPQSRDLGALRAAAATGRRGQTPGTATAETWSRLPDTMRSPSPNRRWWRQRFHAAGCSLVRRLGHRKSPPLHLAGLTPLNQAPAVSLVRGGAGHEHEAASAGLDAVGGEVGESDGADGGRIDRGQNVGGQQDHRQCERNGCS